MTATTPLVSIVMPAYNAQRTIPASVQSVLAQTLTDWELLVADDASSDATVATVEQLAAGDPRVRILALPANGGPARARNAALAAARGRYVAFLDADDLWLPTKLERQTQAMQQGGLAFTYTWYRRFTESPDSAGRLVRPLPAFTHASLLRNTGIACLTVMLDASQLGEVRFPEVRHEDYALWLSLLKRTGQAVCVPEDLARYRVAKTSVSGNKLKSAAWVWRIYRDREGLGIPTAAVCLASYAYNALRRGRAA